MSCKLTMRLISEHQVGECGNDWKYELTAKVFSAGLKGEATVSVPKHILECDIVSEPFGSPEPVVLYAGDCDGELLVSMELTATEVDVLFDDVGKASKDLRFDCPPPGGAKVTKEIDIAAGVRESPGILNKNSVFTVRVRFTLECA